MKARFEKPDPDLRVRATWEDPFRVQSYELRINGVGKFVVNADEFDAAVKRARQRAETEHRSYREAS